MQEPPYKLAELWRVDGDYQIRVMVEHTLLGPVEGASPEMAEHLAQMEVVEVLRHIVAQFDAGEVQIRTDDTLPPPEARRG